MAWCLAVVFLLHPLNVETVAYIDTSQNTILLTFTLAAVLISSSVRLTKIQVFASVVFAGLALFTKESGILCVALVLLYQLLFSRKNFWSYALPFAFLVLFYALMRFGVGHIGFTKISIVPIAQLTFAERLISVPAIIWYYLQSFVLPIHLAVDQQWIVTKLTYQDFFLPLLCDCVIIGILIYIAVLLYRSKHAFFASYIYFFAWFTSGMLLIIQLFPLDMTVADRWFYFPMIGLLGMIGIGLVLVRKIFHNWSVILITGLIISMLFVKTTARVRDWHDELTLFSHDVEVRPSYNLENRYANILIQDGDVEDALVHLQKSVNLYPMEINLVNLAGACLMINNIPKADKYYQQALDNKIYLDKTHKHDIFLYENYAHFLIITNDQTKAIPFIREGLLQFPYSPRLRQYYAVAQYRKGNTEEALTAIKPLVNTQGDPAIQYLYYQIINKQQI
jgi:hypothetical protein